MHAEEEELLVKPFGCACQGRQHYNEVTQLYIFLVSQHKTTNRVFSTDLRYLHIYTRPQGVWLYCEIPNDNNYFMFLGLLK